MFSTPCRGVVHRASTMYMVYRASTMYIMWCAAPVETSYYGVSTQIIRILPTAIPPQGGTSLNHVP